MSSGKPETRQAILAAAVDLFKERGADEVRMVDIARQAGVTRQAVYLHFGSRTGLLVDLVQYVDETGPLADLSRPVWEASTGAEALARFAALQAEYNPSIYPIAQALMSSRYADEACAAAWNDRMESRRDACRSLIRWLQCEETLAPPWDLEVATDALWALSSIQVWEQLVIDLDWSAERYIRYLGATLQRTFVEDSP
jgi:AcrR family transcriptional regulator